MHEGRVVGAHLQCQLADRFQERQRFDIAHSAAHFADRYVHGVISADASAALDVFLDFVGDVGMTCTVLPR